MTPFDLTLLLLLSSALQNARGSGNVSPSALQVLNYWLRRSPAGIVGSVDWSKASRVLLVRDDKIITAHMAREHVTHG